MRCSSPTVKKLISWVRPGVLEVRASFLLPVRLLIALLLPALERPANATSHPLSSGHWENFAALVKKAARR